MATAKQKAAARKNIKRARTVQSRRAHGAAYATYSGAEYLAGYSGPPPIVHLRRGETMRGQVETAGKRQTRHGSPNGTRALVQHFGQSG